MYLPVQQVSLCPACTLLLSNHLGRRRKLTGWLYNNHSYQLTNTRQYTRYQLTLVTGEEPRNEFSTPQSLLLFELDRHP